MPPRLQSLRGTSQEPHVAWYRIQRLAGFTQLKASGEDPGLSHRLIHSLGYRSNPCSMKESGLNISRPLQLQCLLWKFTRGSHIPQRSGPRRVSLWRAERRADGHHRLRLSRQSKGAQIKACRLHSNPCDHHQLQINRVNLLRTLTLCILQSNLSPSLFASWEFKLPPTHRPSAKLSWAPSLWLISRRAPRPSPFP